MKKSINIKRIKSGKKIIYTLVATIMVIIFNQSQTYESQDYYDQGDWVTSNELWPGQTWADFWQARVDNPYSSAKARARAQWALDNGYANCDTVSVYAAYDATCGNSSNTSSYSSTTSSPTNQSIANTSTNSSVANTSNNAPTLTEGDYGTYVVLSKKAVYSSYNSDKEELSSLSKGTEVEVTGNTSNGYYRFTFIMEDGSAVEAYLLYRGKDNIVDKETYDAAWDLTNTVDATCIDDGYIEYTNSLSGLTRREEIKASGHVLGDEELTKEPGLFTKGKIVTHCAVCGEIIETRALDSYLPIWSLGVVAVVIICIVTIIIIRKKINK